MLIPRIPLPLAIALGLAFGVPVLASDDHGAHDASRAPAVRNARGVQEVKLAVTKDGFEPSAVTVKAGKPVKLVVTRTVERTCATEIVMKDFGVNRPLPLDEPVTITVTPKKAGDYRYACGMDMIAGVLKAE